MTTEELDLLPHGSIIYVPNEWEVNAWVFSGKVPNRNYYTLLHPPDTDGVITNRRPAYINAIELLEAKLIEHDAWIIVESGLKERLSWVQKKLESFKD